MNKIEIEFIERYKQLDKICQDMFATYQGASEYILRMENYYTEGKPLLRDWADCYYTIKHLRWLRNQIVHEVKESECSEEDIQDVIDFYQEIFHQQDPLTRLARWKQTKKHNQPRYKKTVYPKRKQNDSFLLHFIIIFILIILIGILIKISVTL